MVANNANFVLLLIKEKLEFKRAKISRSFFGFCFVCFCQRLQGWRFACAPATHQLCYSISNLRWHFTMRKFKLIKNWRSIYLIPRNLQTAWSIFVNRKHNVIKWSKKDFEWEKSCFKQVGLISNVNLCWLHFANM